MAGPTAALMAAALGALLFPIAAFNIHPDPHRILEVAGTPSFGSGVLALPGGRVVVGAPAVGRLYGCEVQSAACKELPLWGNRSAAHMGMALSRHGNNTVACGPGLRLECNHNVHVGGQCAVLGPQLQPVGLLEAGQQGCVPSMVDLVFLFDGSGSVSAAQFGAMRDFMVEAMEQLSNSSFRFGAVQFSDYPEPVFSLRDYAERPRPRELLGDVRQQGGLTDTFAAISYVAEQIFTAENGSRPAARRVLIIVTDGDATDNGTVRAAEERGILRYVIGVGRNFRSARSRALLELLASQPSSHFVTVLDSFQRLRGIFSQLQQRIYAIEGTSAQHRFHLELSSAGISAATVNGRLVTGAVGADNWAGGVLQVDPPPETFVPNPEVGEDAANAYLGYAVVAVPQPGPALLAVGAPRRRHVGGVELLEGGAGGWRRKQSLEGEQLGSYFGSALCAVGGPEAALLVGAPLHFDGRRGGRVHVYQWRAGRLRAVGQLWGSAGQPLGRFGSALSALGAAAGSGEEPLVAVGAPMEDGGSGAVYVCRAGGRPLCVQRLAGRAVAAGLQHFGTALDGAHDVSGDGLTDIAVGTHGRVVILSSRPLFSVSARLSVSVRSLPNFWGHCGGGGGAVGLQLCFQPRLLSPTYSGRARVPISFLLAVDPQRRFPRGRFTSGSGSWEGRLQLGGERSCLQQNLNLPPCPEDTLTPLRLAVNYSLDPTDPTDGPIPVLDPTTTSAWIEVPFEQRCGSAGRCQPDVSLRAVSPPGGWILLGGPENAVKALWKLHNGGGDAPGVAVQIRHPAGTALRRATAAMEGGSSPVGIDCREVTEGTRVGTEEGTLQCHVGHPVLRANSTVLLEVSLEVTRNHSWGGQLTLCANVSSPNEAPETLGDNAECWSAPVRYRVEVLATWLEDSTPYLSFTSGQTHSAALRHHYQVQTLLPAPPGAPPPNLTAFLLLPQTLPHGLAWQPHVRTENGTECEEVGGEEEDGPLWGLEQGCVRPQPPLLFRCPLGPHWGGKVLLSATLRLLPHGQAPWRWQLCSRLWFWLGSELLHNGIAGGQQGVQGVTEVELLAAPPPLLLMYLGGAAGGALLLLLLGVVLLRFGFFRRGYRQRMEEGGGGDEKDPDVGGWEEGEGKDPDVGGWEEGEEEKDPDVGRRKEGEGKDPDVGKGGGEEKNPDVGKGEVGEGKDPDVGGGEAGKL